MGHKTDPRTRGQRWPFRVQHFDDRPRVRRWGDWKGTHTLEDAIKYIQAQGGDAAKWRVRSGIRTVWPLKK